MRAAWILMLSSCAWGGPPAGLCDQAALDALAIRQNARYAAVNLPGMDTTLRLEPAQTVPGTPITVGDRVRAKGNAGTYKPEDSGHASELRISEQVGTLACWVAYERGRFSGHVAVVSWAAQTWHVDRPRVDQMVEGRLYDAADINKMDVRGAPVEHQAFQATIHPEYLAPAVDGASPSAD